MAQTFVPDEKFSFKIDPLNDCGPFRNSEDALVRVARSPLMLATAANFVNFGKAIDVSCGADVANSLGIIFLDFKGTKPAAEGGGLCIANRRNAQVGTFRHHLQWGRQHSESDL
jgi:hypothetical protein